MSGLFISFEGIDGAGKSTHIEALVQAFEALGRRVTRTREPGGTPLAEHLRQLLLHEPMDAMTEALVAFAARRDHLQQIIVPALQRHEVVLSDRFTDATFAYQGAGGGLSWQFLSTLERWVQDLVQPDVTIWFDVPPAIAAERLKGARLPDKFESQPLAYFKSVRDGYAERMAQDSGRFIRIDANQPQPAVWAQVHHAMQERGLLAC